MLRVTLLIASFILSRLMFFLIDDPEGPNLLIVTVLALVIFVMLHTAISLIRSSK
ncbi:MAG: hypothetical protein RL094_419 [Candidatus Parcubacteria bacterium]|jgi:hypothetical protein